MSKHAPPTIDELAHQLRDDGHRDLADAIELLASRAEQIPESEAEEFGDIVDLNEIPLPPHQKMPFVIGMAFGGLMERRFPKGREDEWPLDETDVPV